MNKYSDKEQDIRARANRGRRMSEIDQQPPEVRGLVHDYGWTVVKAFLDVGIKKPKHIKHCVERVLDEFSPTRGSFSGQGIRGEKIVKAPAPIPQNRNTTQETP